MPFKLDSKHFHYLSFIVGLAFYLLSLYQAIFLHYVHFYTSFAVGGWLILDFIDYRLTRKSILTFFFNHKHRLTFLFFFILATVFCFIVDYWWGVRVTKMWQWVNYGPVEFIRMYIFMNAAFVLGMYELYRIVRYFLQQKISSKHLFHFRLHNGKAKDYIVVLVIGIIFLITPAYAYVFDTSHFLEYAMIFPFISMIYISDAITYLTGGKPILEEIIRVNVLDVTSYLVTVILAVVATEGINVMGNEWYYTKMPFGHITLAGVPVAVFFGWIPLVVGSIALINMIKHLDYKYNARG